MKKFKLLSGLLAIILSLAVMPGIQARSEMSIPQPESTSSIGDKYFFFETFTNINGVGDVGPAMLIDFPMYYIILNPLQVQSMVDLELTENTAAVIADGVSRSGTAGGGISSGLFTSDSYSGKGGDYEWKAESDGTLNFKYEDKWIKLAVGETFEDTIDITPEGLTGKLTQTFTVTNYGFIDKTCVITPNRPKKTPAGDLNGDGQINAIDLGVMTKYLLGKISEIPADDDLWAADLNGDNVINATDCAYLRKYLLGMISHFSKE